jgi:high-affinity K+ transport system ATPase subunit B
VSESSDDKSDAEVENKNGEFGESSGLQSKGRDVTPRDGEILYNSAKSDDEQRTGPSAPVGSEHGSEHQSYHVSHHSEHISSAESVHSDIDCEMSSKFSFGPFDEAKEDIGSY